MATHMTDPIQSLLDELMRPPRIPRATYRLQFGVHTGFQDALALTPYLEALGVSDLYASPLFTPRTGSPHGYDTVDYHQLNPALGSAEDFDALSDDLTGRGMGLLLDIVPNHMGASTENAWWADVLKQGPSSDYAHYFDIDWRPTNRALDDKVLLPILGDHYGRILEAGELKVVYWHGDFYLHYYEHQLPITPETYQPILQLALDGMAAVDESEAWMPLELASVIHSLTYMPSYRAAFGESKATRQREQVILRWRLLGLFDKSATFRSALQAALEQFNGMAGDPASVDALDRLLEAQPYRLTYWRVATDEINYRRFFDINDLVAVRIEDPQVFADVHRLALRFLAEGKASGLRIDHPDGLWDPESYYWDLQRAYLEETVRVRLGDDAEATPQIQAHLEQLRADQPQRAEWPLYVVAEKILSDTEPLPFAWAVHGTTGYDFMYAANNLFVDAGQAETFEEIYAEFTGAPIDFAELTDTTKKLVMSQSLASELDAISSELNRILEYNRRYRDYTRNSLRFGLSEFIAALDIYRTYISEPGDVSERDRYYIEQAATRAKARNPLVPSSIFDLLRETLLMQNFDEFAPPQQEELRQFVMRFQQITGPVMAKSVEDTAFYIYNRLVSLNEVGGHPEHFGSSVAEFHAHNVDKAYPYTMLAGSTHDTKRSEDVRARLNVLSEIPDEWRMALAAWRSINAPAKTTIGDELAPSANDEYLLYQSLLGAYEPQPNTEPGQHDADFLTRIIGYMHKAINEAKVHSNWINPNEAYAQAITDFVTQAWANPHFRASFDPFHRRVAFFGRINSLAQTLLRLTSPGVPDIYQGTELWNFSLVDPDNRRPVDFAHAQATLAELQAAEAQDRAQLARDLLADPAADALKLYLVYRTLTYRRQHEARFRDGAYQPLEVAGSKAKHICAFLRRGAQGNTLVVVPRLLVGLTGGEMTAPLGDIWGDTHLILPKRIAWTAGEELFTGVAVPPNAQGERATLPLADLLVDYPLAVLDLR